MKYAKRLAAALIAAVMLLFTASCGTDPADAVIYFELSGKPYTLDAQTASDENEIVIINNIYEGLLRYNESGAAVCGASESYTVNELVYTFKIKEDLVWSNGYPLTADDFLFAFQRALSPETKAPFVSKLFCIKGAKKAYETGNLSEIGVAALDDYTLQITLEKEDPDFDSVLASAVCMPCNRQFFNECAGKYGLTMENVITNGSYELKKWNKDDFGIRIYKSESYSGEYTANNAAVFMSCVEDESAHKRLKENKVDIGFLPDTDYTLAKKDGLKIYSSQSTLLVLCVNEKFSPAIRQSFSKLTSGKVYMNSLKGSYAVANSLYPAALNVKDTENIGFTVYDLETAQELFSNAVGTLPDKKFPSSTLYYYDDAYIKDIATAIAGHWQQNISAFVNIKAEKDITILKKALTQESEMDFVLVPVNATSSSVSEYLSQYGIDYTNEDPALMQESLLSGDMVIPIAFSSKHVAYTNSIGRVYGKVESGQIDFCYTVKKE